MTAVRSTAVRSTAVVTSIDIGLAPFDWPFPHAEAARIDAHWACLSVDKPGLFDGRVVLSRDVAVVEGTLRGSAFATGYKSFLCWRDFGYPGVEVRNLFAMAALRAADGAFMLGRMAAATANAGRLYFPAGTPEPSDVGPDGRLRLDANILRELEEETGLTATEVTLDATWTVLFAGPMVACLKVARADLTTAALVERVAAFVAAERAPELDGLYPVRAAADLDPARMPLFMTHYLEAALAQP